jgi:hypothetical protein
LNVVNWQISSVMLLVQENTKLVHVVKTARISSGAVYLTNS